MANNTGIDIRIIRDEAFPVAIEGGCVVTNTGANSVYYKTSSDVDTGDTELAAAASVTLTVDTFFIAASGAFSTVTVDHFVDDETWKIYRTVISPRAILLPDTVAASTYVALAGSSTATAAATTGSAAGVFYLDPADYAIPNKATQYRVKADLLANNVSVDTFTATWGLYPVSATAGGNDAQTITLGTVTSGSTVAFVDAALSSRNTGNSGVFSAPAAGYYALGVVTSDAPGANSYITTSASLQVRNA